MTQGKQSLHDQIKRTNAVIYLYRVTDLGQRSAGDRYVDNFILIFYEKGGYVISFQRTDLAKSVNNHTTHAQCVRQ